MRDILSQKRASPEQCKRDLLDQVIDDIKTETFLTDDFVLYIMFGLLLASSETISSTLTLAIKLLTDHPYVVQELTVCDVLYFCYVFNSLFYFKYNVTISNIMEIIG